MAQDGDDRSAAPQGTNPRGDEGALAAVGLTSADLPLSDAGLGRAAHATPQPWGRWVFAALALAALAAASMMAARHRSAATIAGPARSLTAPREVVALGRLEPLGGVRSVAAPQSSAAPRVREVLVEEGDRVVRGQTLVVLDNQPGLEAACRAAERAVDVAVVTLEQARRNLRSARAESEASVSAARVAADLARRDSERSTRLHRTGSIPAAQIDAAEASTARAGAELRRAEATASRYADTSDVRLAEARLGAARADLDRARAELELATVRAPVAGTVLSIDVHPGERASSGTLVRLADLEHMEAELEAFQDAVPTLRVGDPVRLASTVFGQEPLRGTIRQIGGEVRRQALTSTDPAAHADARVVHVYVALDAASVARSSRFVGLEVIAHIETRRVGARHGAADDAGARP